MPGGTGGRRRSRSATPGCWPASPTWTLVGVTDVAAAGGGRARPTGTAPRACADVAAAAGRRTRRGLRLRAAVRARPGRGGGRSAPALPMFVEKPLAVDLADRRADRRPGRRGAGCVTAVGHHWRYLERGRAGRASCWPDRPVRLVNGVWLDKVPPVAWWTRRDRSGGPVVEQAAHVLDLARALVGEVDRGVRASATAPRRRSTAPTSTRPPPPRCASPPARSARSARPACWAGSSAPAWRSSPTGWRCSLSEDGAGRPRRRRRTALIAGDPEAARVAVDRAFVDAVRGVGDDVRVPYAEALRTHRAGLRDRRVGADRPAGAPAACRGGDGDG